MSTLLFLFYEETYTKYKCIYFFKKFKLSLFTCCYKPLIRLMIKTKRKLQCKIPGYV